MRAVASISRMPIRIERVIASVLSPSAGGTAVFIGTVRNRSGRMKVSRMKLEAAEDLAERDLKRIAENARTRFDICRVAVQHRVGELKVGDVIAVIAVSARHRADAFSACKFVIDELKKSTPIWKKEIGGRMQRWAEAE